MDAVVEVGSCSTREGIVRGSCRRVWLRAWSRANSLVLVRRRRLGRAFAHGKPAPEILLTAAWEPGMDWRPGAPAGIGPGCRRHGGHRARVVV